MKQSSKNSVMGLQFMINMFQLIQSIIQQNYMLIALRFFLDGGVGDAHWAYVVGMDHYVWLQIPDIIDGCANGCGYVCVLLERLQNFPSISDTMMYLSIVLRIYTAPLDLGEGIIQGGYSLDMGMYHPRKKLLSLTTLYFWRSKICWIECEVLL